MTADDAPVRAARPRPRRRAERRGAESEAPAGVPGDEGPTAWGEVPEDGDRWLEEQRPPHHGG